MGREKWRHALDVIPKSAIPEPPFFLKHTIGEKDHFSVAFFVRMIYSCLVDADFLDTEQFMDPGRGASRPEWPSDILRNMEDALTDFIEEIKPNDTNVNRQRSLVREACLGAAKFQPGLFSLTVPTGGGKTLSSLAFALRHALKYNLRRLIYVAPFTTIIEQNADVFRRAFAPLTTEGGADPVLEHHSNLEPLNETVTSRLAAENWDAPLIITTSVQFYESLFANRSSRCRKLHNLARSVIILDEAQTLPVDYLEPCLRSLDELARNYGATIVLCTATQPAIHRREDFAIGLDHVREIIPDPNSLYKDLKRVDVEEIGHQSDEDLTSRLLEEERVLCIVNTRNHARKLFEMLGEAEGHFHLSALMCPEHRTNVFKSVREHLNSDRICRVITTQLIEAGVDIDFPVVYRSLTGLDSIAQAAGRCNRNGKLAAKGKTFVFRSKHTPSERFFAETANNTTQVLPLHDDPLSLEAIEHYFQLYYWDQKSRWDAKKILAEFRMVQDRDFPFLFGFTRVAKNFHLIDSPSRSVIIPWGEKGTKLCERLRFTSDIPGRELLRTLQRYTVQIPIRTWNEQISRSIELVQDRFPVLISLKLHYSEQTGLSFDDGEQVFLEG